jgi:hypothetical protein
VEIKHFTQRSSYRIEPNPNGGFIARSTDPTVPSIGASTREELHQKIQAHALAAVFRGKPAGEFPIDATGAQPHKQPSREEITEFAQEFVDTIGKNFPELSEALAARAGLGNAKTFANQKTPITIDASSPNAGFGSAVANTPITPEASGNGKILRFLLALLIIAAATYFFFHHR